MAIDNHNTKTPAEIRDNWETLDETVMDALNLTGVEFFDLDAAANERNSRGMSYFDEGMDALKMEWRGEVWCNPPFSKKKEFLTKAYIELLAGNIEMACLLIPCEPATKWWKDCVLGKAQTVYIPDGRYSFRHPETGEVMDQPKFPSCFVVFQKAKFATTQYVHFERTIRRKKSRKP